MRRFLILSLTICIVCITGAGCRNVGKYADDAYKYIDDAAGKFKGPKRASVPKDCPYCDGGYYWFNGYQYECSHCSGKGFVIERI